MSSDLTDIELSAELAVIASRDDLESKIAVGDIKHFAKLLPEKLGHLVPQL
jgi:hypothetical protein